jgi:ABC-2 type transport system permease protein
LKKEAVQMIRDRGTLQFALLVPAFQLVLFGLIDTNVKHVRTIVFDQSRTQESRQLLNDFVNTSFFDIVAYAPSRSCSESSCPTSSSPSGSFSSSCFS